MSLAIYDRTTIYENWTSRRVLQSSFPDLSSRDVDLFRVGDDINNSKGGKVLGGSLTPTLPRVSSGIFYYGIPAELY